MREEGVSFGGNSKTYAGLPSKTAIFSFLTVRVSDQKKKKKGNRRSHHCQPDGDKAETKARVSGGSFRPGNVALGKRGGKEEA